MRNEPELSEREEKHRWSSRGKLPPINSFEEFEQYLREDLGYSGCADPEDAMEILRHVLRATGRSGMHYGTTHTPTTDINRRTTSFKPRFALSRRPGQRCGSCTFWTLISLPSTETMFEKAGYPTKEANFSTRSTAIKGVNRSVAPG